MSTPLHEEVSRAIDQHRVQIAKLAVTQQYTRNPNLAGHQGERGRVRLQQEASRHLDYLATSVAMAAPPLFADYMAWAKVMAVGRDNAIEDLTLELECLCIALETTLPENLATLAVEYGMVGLNRLRMAPVTLPTLITEDKALSPLAHEYLAALLNGERQRASRMILDAVESGISVQDIYLKVFQSCQHEIGRLWQMNQISVAQEHFCTAATQFVMSQLYPYLFTGKRTGRTLVATCIAGDLHEIGVRMVSDIFELNGWDTYYLGANNPIPSILQAVREQKADVLAISATIIPHLRAVKELIDEIHHAEGCGTVKIVVGGYPFKIVPEMWRELGADGCAHDAATSVDLANHLVSIGDSS